MPNFNKSKGFQLKSGNKAKAPFKMMGSSSPAKGWDDILSMGKKANIEKADQSSTVQGVSSKAIEGVGNSTKSANVKVANVKVATPEELRKKHKEEGNKITNKERKEAGEGSRLQRIGKGIKEGVKKTKEYIKENPQAIRDMGAVISNIGNEDESMSSVIQGQADRKQERADKDIQNEKDKVSTERTQQLVDTYKKENSGEGELAATETTANPADTETAAEKVKKQKEAKRLKMQEERAGEYEENK